MTQKEKLADAYHNSPALQDAYLAGYNECEKTYQKAISELRSKILHLEDRTNDFEVMGAFGELEDKVKGL